MIEDSRDYLEYILGCLKKRLSEIDENLVRGEKEIGEMHAYYWENYTEMDQYGYENFDNQQALLGQVNANREQLFLKQRFQKMMDSPYFGRVDFVYEGEEEPEAFLYRDCKFFQRGGEDSTDLRLACAGVRAVL